jgi:hypothetical protein
MVLSARRRGHGLLFLTVFGTSVAGLSLSLALSATTYAADVSSASVLASARTAIASQTGVHVVFTAHSGSTGITEKIVADVGTTAGTETIFESSADVAIRVTPTFAYVSGNSSGLTNLFGMSSANAKKLGTRWEAWKAGTKQYTNLKSDVTMKSVSDLLPKAKGTKVATDSRHGATLYVLTWATPATTTVPKLSNRLALPAQGAALPNSQTTTASGGTKIKTALSKWGETVTVQPPAPDRTVSSSHIGS